MSFVLDALKISERRRSKFQRPVYVHPPRPFRARRRRGWIAALGSAAAIVLVFAAWRLLVPSPSASSYPTETAGQQGAGAATINAADGTTLALGSQTGDEDRRATSEVSQVGSGGSEPPAETPAASGGVASASAPITAADETEPAEPLLSAAPADWPVLELQMLFFSPESGRSFAQINGGSYQVGDRLEDGPQVREITTDGVILAHQGQKVRLRMQR